MAFEDETDIQLFQLASAGDEAAFVAFYRRWQGSIYRFSLRLSNSISIAEDVTQEVFLALMGGASGFDPSLGLFSSYIYGIARNHILRRMTRERIFERIVDDAEDERQGLQNAWGPSSDPLGDLTRKEMIDSLHRALATLPLRYREVVVLYELQELSYADAARVIGCPEGTIRSRLHRARILLLEKLREMTKEDVRAPRIEPARCLL